MNSPRALLYPPWPAYRCALKTFGRRSGITIERRRQSPHCRAKPCANHFMREASRVSCQLLARRRGFFRKRVTARSKLPRVTHRSHLAQKPLKKLLKILSACIKHARSDEQPDASQEAALQVLSERESDAGVAGTGWISTLTPSAARLRCTRGKSCHRLCAQRQRIRWPQCSSQTSIYGRRSRRRPQEIPIHKAWPRCLTHARSHRAEHSTSEPAGDAAQAGSCPRSASTCAESRQLFC